MESRKSPRARHDATLPFTRMLAGALDYTPVHFGERRNDTTWAHQLATAVSFTSGLLTYAAHPKALVESPAVDLIRSIPAVWDETRVLRGSEIGEVSILARRSGKIWFLAVLNGESPRRLKVPLSFLKSGSWSTLAASDPQNLEKTTTTPDTTLDLDLTAGGGYLARYTRREP
jgi:alpha-glucosidase